MAGLAKTSNFMIGAGTLMLGPQASLWDLLPATHSVGLVKNISTTSDPAWADLTQGSKNTVVYSMLTGNPVKISAEVYEYTAQNLTYGLSLDGSGVTTQTASTTTTAAVLGATTAPTLVIPFTAFTGFADGDTIALIDPSTDDVILIRKIVSHSSLNVTVDVTIKADFPSGSVVKKLNTVDIGSTADSGFLSAKIAGKLANGTPVVQVFPKVRIVKGFNLAFNSEQYQNMPFEIEVMDLLPTDSFYSTFSTKKGGLYVP